MSSELQPHRERVAFDSFEFEMTSAELFKKGRKIRLAKQPADLLVLLVRRRGTLVSRNELRYALWPDDSFVDFNHGLNNCIRRIREALGDSAESQRFVETLPKKGYRFVPETRLVVPPPGTLPAEIPHLAGPSLAEDSVARSSPCIAPASTKDDFSKRAIMAEQTIPEPVVSSVTEPAERKWNFVRWISLTGLLTVMISGTFPIHREVRPRVSLTSRHLASHVHDLTLSRDGKLVGYIESSGELPHIWVRQIWGEKSLQVTNGPQPDRSPDLSPDGTQIAFVSARGEGGVYVVSSLGGEPKLIAPGGLSPKFSPDGTKVLYSDRQQQPFTVPVESGRPNRVPLATDLKMLTSPFWSASGMEIIFDGIRSSGSKESRAWWIAPLSGGEPRRARLPQVEQHRGLFPAVRDWYRAIDGREWILYGIDSGDHWSLFRVQASPSGTFARQAELLASGQGQLGFQSRLSQDGKLAYNTLVLGGVIDQIATGDHGRKMGSTERLPLPEELNCHSPSVSRDGRWMLYTTSSPGKSNRALLRDLSTGAEQFVDDGVSSPDGGTNSISPDGSAIIVGRDCRPGPCAFLFRRAGGDSQKLCERCTARGFSSDGAVVLVDKYAMTDGGLDKIVAFDLASMKEKNFLSDPDHPLQQASFSWDDRWVVFKRQFVATSQIVIAPVQEVASSKPGSWIAVTNGSSVDDKPRFSPEGDSVYFLSSQDGHTCIWNQRLNPQTKRPVGPPMPYEHLHNLSFDFFRLGRTELSVSKSRIVISRPDVVSDLWIKQIE